MIDEHVFTPEYTNDEVVWLDLPKEWKSGELELKTVRPWGSCPGYFNKWFEVREVTCPLLAENGDIWMSLTSMEVQAAVVPLAHIEAGDRVGTAGLGLGYFPLKAAAKGADVVVYENNREIIKLFCDHTRPKHPELSERIQIIEADVREAMQGHEFDLVFMDPYQDMLPEEVISDIRLFCGNNDIAHYRFWGLERVVVTAIMEHHMGYMSEELDCHMVTFFEAWADDDGRTKLYQGGPDEDYCGQVLQALDEYDQCPMMLEVRE